MDKERVSLKYDPEIAVWPQDQEDWVCVQTLTFASLDKTALPSLISVFFFSFFDVCDEDVELDTV